MVEVSVLKEKILIWPFCEKCNIPCIIIKEKPHLFKLFKPSKIPDRFKCKWIKEWEQFNKDKAILEEKSKELMNGCKTCNLECDNPRRKNGDGGDNCKKKYSKKEKIYIKKTKATFIN